MARVQLISGILFLLLFWVLPSGHCKASSTNSTNSHVVKRKTRDDGSSECPAPCPPCPGCPGCPPVPACPNPPSCTKKIPPGYKLYEGLGYYKMHSVPQNWYEAKATCEREGAHLMVLNSQKEAEVIDKLANDRFTYILVGVHDLFLSREFYTVLDGPVNDTGYNVWNAGEPNNSKERCGSYYPGKGLNDIWCFGSYVFVCEYPI